MSLCTSNGPKDIIRSVKLNYSLSPLYLRRFYLFLVTSCSGQISEQNTCKPPNLGKGRGRAHLDLILLPSNIIQNGNLAISRCSSPSKATTVPLSWTTFLTMAFLKSISATSSPSLINLASSPSMKIRCRQVITSFPKSGLFLWRGTDRNSGASGPFESVKGTSLIWRLHHVLK